MELNEKEPKKYVISQLNPHWGNFSERTYIPFTFSTSLLRMWSFKAGSFLI